MVLIVANHRDVFMWGLDSVGAIPRRQGPFETDTEALVQARLLPLEAGRRTKGGIICVDLQNYRGTKLRSRRARWHPDFPVGQEAFLWTHGEWPERERAWQPEEAVGAGERGRAAR